MLKYKSYAGQSIKVLHENGKFADKKKISGTTRKYSFFENFPFDGIERFQQQLETVDLIQKILGQFKLKLMNVFKKNKANQRRFNGIDEQAQKMKIVKKDKNEEVDKLLFMLFLIKIIFKIFF